LAATLSQISENFVFASNNPIASMLQIYQSTRCWQKEPSAPSPDLACTRTGPNLRRITTPSVPCHLQAV
jgi:hypothetical protein